MAIGVKVSKKNKNFQPLDLELNLTNSQNEYSLYLVC